MKLICRCLLMMIFFSGYCIEARAQSPRKLYQVSGKAFSINTLPEQSGILYAAFLNDWDNGTIKDDFKNTMMSFGYPDKVDMYKIRRSKTYQNFIKAFIEEGIQDPKLIEIIYQLVEPVWKRFETSFALWPPNTPLPGATDENNIVKDKWSTDYNKVYDSSFTDQRAAVRRRRAWAGMKITNGPWGMNPTEEDRKSPRYKSSKDSGRKKILYMSEQNDYTSIPSYGTTRHALDMQLGSQHLFWAGYILDVNRHLNPKYGMAADSLWDFKVNHWELDAPDVLGARHPVYKFYSKPSILHHSNDAHTSLFHANVVWHTLREGKPRPDDVTALQYLFQTILDDTYLFPVPPEAPEYATYKGAGIANYSHWNNATARLLKMDEMSIPGDLTYSLEREGTLLSLMHGKVTGTGGKIISDDLLHGMSNLFALIIEQGIPASGKWELPNDISGYKEGSKKESTVLFNNGEKGSGFAYGGSTPPDLLASEAKKASGGFYLSWDKTGRQIKLFNQRGKNYHFIEDRFDVAEVLKNPKHTMAKQWGWLNSFLLLSLRRPDIDLSKIETPK